MKNCCRVDGKNTEVGEIICYCFEITKSKVVEEIRKYGHSPSLLYVRDMVKNGLCECSVKNPEGICCLPKFERFVSDVMNNENHNKN